jgi:hypothetical protein
MLTKAQRRRRSLLFAGRLLVVYLALFGLTRWFPTFFPHCVAPLLPAVVQVIDSDYEVTDIQIDSEYIVVDTATRKFVPFATVDGVPPPVFHFNPDLQIEAINIYLVIVFTVLLAWPMPLRLRFISHCFAFLLVPVAGALDLAGVVLWWGSQWLTEAWLQVRTLVLSTPENLALFKGIEAHQERMDWINWAVSTSRPFIALFTAVLSVGLGMVVIHLRGKDGAEEGE